VAATRTRTQAERSESTRELLISAARRLFTEHGYEGTSTEEVVRQASVSRGALYHHFEGKRDLFRAVFEEVEREIYERVVAAIGSVTEVDRRVSTGVRTFFDACLEPSAQRVALLEAPTVLGWETWREIDGQFFFGLISDTLRQGMETGHFERRPVEPLTQIMLGALTEAALAIARSADVAVARDAYTDAVLRLIEGLEPRDRVR
jgi:AcrR family transcriptional regulator